MTNDKQHITYQNSGISTMWLLTIVFIVLKLTETINWSWWWILSPLWISAIVGLTLFAIIFIIVLVTTLIKR